MIAEALLPHPFEGLGVRVVTAQTDLDEVAAWYVALFDQPVHGLTVAHHVAEHGLRGIVVGVEVNNPDVALAVHVCEPGHIGVHQGMVSTDDHRDDVLTTVDRHLGNLADELPDGGHAALGAEHVHGGVAIVDDRQLLERIDEGQHVVHGERAPPDGARRGSHCQRAPSRAPVSGAHVRVGSHDGHIHLARAQVLGRQSDGKLEERGNPRPSRTAKEPLNVDRPRLSALRQVVAGCLPQVVCRIPGVHGDDCHLALAERCQLVRIVRVVVVVLGAGR